MNHDDAHGLRVQLATASALADEWRAKANQLLALCGRLEGDLTEARAGRDNWKEACRKTEQERDSRDWTGLQSECDALRAENGRLREALQEARTELRCHHSCTAWDGPRSYPVEQHIDAALAGGGDRG